MLEEVSEIHKKRIEIRGEFQMFKLIVGVASVTFSLL